MRSTTIKVISTKRFGNKSCSYKIRRITTPAVPWYALILKTRESAIESHAHFLTLSCHRHLPLQAALHALPLPHTGEQEVSPPLALQILLKERGVDHPGEDPLLQEFIGIHSPKTKIGHLNVPLEDMGRGAHPTHTEKEEKAAKVEKAAKGMRGTTEVVLKVARDLLTINAKRLNPPQSIFHLMDTPVLAMRCSTHPVVTIHIAGCFTAFQCEISERESARA
jgi:hypothetical protein